MNTSEANLFEFTWFDHFSHDTLKIFWGVWFFVWQFQIHILMWGYFKILALCCCHPCSDDSDLVYFHLWV